MFPEFELAFYMTAGGGANGGQQGTGRWLMPVFWGPSVSMKTSKRVEPSQVNGLLPS